MKFLQRLFGKKNVGSGPTGFFDGLSKEQQEAALEYDGEENLGDPDFSRGRKRFLTSRTPLPEPRPYKSRHYTPMPPPAPEWRPPTREEAERLQAANDRERHVPAALMALEKYPERGAKRLFDALYQEYVDCLLSGRLDQWAKTGHSIVDLLASPTVKIHKRDEVSPLPALPVQS